MTGSSQPPRRPLATFLRKGAAPSAPVPEQVAVEQDAHAAVEPVADAAPPAQDVPPSTEPDAVADATATEAGTEADVIAPEPARSATPETIAQAFDDVDTVRAQDPIAPLQPDTSGAPVHAPSFMLPLQPQRPAPRWHWALIGVLALALLVQIMVADRARLAADAGSRPWVAGLCTVLRCTLPAWHEPKAFTMLSREIRPAADQPGALLVKASFRNDARWAQAWPDLKLSLSDADGRTIGSSVFTPADYLGHAIGEATVLDPGQAAQVSFRVREPAAATVAFTFDFE